MTDPQITKETRKLIASKESAESDLREINDRIETARTSEKNALNATQKAQGELENLRTTIDNYSSRKASMEAELSKLNDSLVSIQSDIASLDKRKGELQSSTEAFDESLRLQETERKSRLEVTFEEKNREISALAWKKEALEIEWEGMITAIERGNDDIRDIRLSIEKETERANSMTDRIAGLSVELNRLNDLVAEASQKLGSIKSQREDEEKRIGDLDAEISRMNDRISEKRGEMLELDAKMEVEKKKYDESKNKLFVIGARERALADRETYIRARYAEAGIAFPEIRSK